MMKGKIIFELTNIGSKSEFVLPFLLLEDGTKVKVGFKGDHPFEQPTLHLYDQKEVIVDGEFNENKKFIITAIEEVVSETENVCEQENDSEIDLCAETEVLGDEEDCEKQNFDEEDSEEVETDTENNNEEN